MKIIITEEQQTSIKHKLQNMVKDLGWKKTYSAVGNPENLVKLAFNNDPMEFLNMFNNLDVVQSKDEPNWVLFRYKKGNNMLVYCREIDLVYINYYYIWSFLQDVFGFSYVDVQKFTKRWLSETYNLRGISTRASGKDKIIVV